MNSLSREKRQEFDIYKDYFEMFNPSGFKEFYYSTKYRCYFNPKVYPVFKRDMHNWFKDKEYYPESQLENPKKDGVWYVKPNAGSNGEGIIITDDVSREDMKNAVYQQSIENPLLYNGRKQDIRIFVVLQTYDGYFKSYIYYEAPIRLSPLQYDKNNLSVEVQLTNHDLYWEDFKPKHDKEIMESGLQPFTKHKYFKELYKQVEDIVMDFSNEVYNKMNNNIQRNLIHIFGLDVMPDKDKKVWLLEINDNPHPTSSDDRLFKPFTSYAKDMIEDMLDELIYPMKNKTDVKPNKFETVYEKELLYNKWIFV